MIHERYIMCHNPRLAQSTSVMEVITVNLFTARFAKRAHSKKDAMDISHLLIYELYADINICERQESFMQMRK